MPLRAAHFQEDLLCDPAAEINKLYCYDERGGKIHWTPQRLNYGRTGKPGGRGSLGHWLCGNGRV